MVVNQSNFILVISIFKTITFLLVKFFIWSFFNVEYWSEGAFSTLEIETKSRGIYTRGHFLTAWIFFISLMTCTQLSLSLHPLKNDLVENWPQLQSFELEFAPRDLHTCIYTWNFQTLFRGCVKGVLEIYEALDSKKIFNPENSAERDCT